MYTGIAKPPKVRNGGGDSLRQSRHGRWLPPARGKLAGQTISYVHLRLGPALRPASSAWSDCLDAPAAGGTSGRPVGERQRTMRRVGG